MIDPLFLLLGIFAVVFYYPAILVVAVVLNVTDRIFR